MRDYIVSSENRVIIGGELILTNRQIVESIRAANDALASLDSHTKDFDINIFEALGMRNLSGIVGEYFAKSIQRNSGGALHSNPHQDGYPDLVLTNTPGRKAYFDTLYTVKAGGRCCCCPLHFHHHGKVGHRGPPISQSWF